MTQFLFFLESPPSSWWMGESFIIVAFVRRVKSAAVETSFFIFPKILWWSISPPPLSQSLPLHLKRCRHSWSTAFDKGVKATELRTRDQTPLGARTPPRFSTQTYLYTGPENVFPSGCHSFTLASLFTLLPSQASPQLSAVVCPGFRPAINIGGQWGGGADCTYPGSHSKTWPSIVSLILLAIKLPYNPPSPP